MQGCMPLNRNSGAPFYSPAKHLIVDRAGLPTPSRNSSPAAHQSKPRPSRPLERHLKRYQPHTVYLPSVSPIYVLPTMNPLACGNCGRTYSSGRNSTADY